MHDIWAHESNGHQFSPAFQPTRATDTLHKVQGHWVLAAAGKRVLRPGGLALTQRMLEALAIGPQDRVVEFAPGLGVTARMDPGN